MPSLWIVHRADRERQALARLAGEEPAVLGAPGDAVFDEAAPPQTVVLGVTGVPGQGRGSSEVAASPNWEPELEFVHRQRARLVGAQWIVVGAPEAAPWVETLFDQLPVTFLAYPPHPARLREQLQTPPAPLPSLSQRAERDAVAARFRRWFGEGPPELLRALDPRLAGVPLLVRGEPGSGRGALLQYVHHFGGTSDGAWLHCPCSETTRLEQLAERLRSFAADDPGARRVCCWLDDVGRLQPAVQRELAGWVEQTRPRGVRSAVRWVASFDETGPALEPTLAQALGTLELRVPTVREHPERIATWAHAAVEAFCKARRVPPRALGADALTVLQEYPWPGNLRELEAVIDQTLAATDDDPVGASDLSLDGIALAPLDASAVGTLLPDPAPEAAANRLERPDLVERSDEAPRLGAGPWVVGAADSEPAAIAEPPPATPIDADPAAEPPLVALARALSGEVRNPLKTLQTFAELLPKRFDDPNFRSRFAETVIDDVARMQRGLGRLEDLAALPAPHTPTRVDLTSILEALLEERRSVFRRRDLLVLKELDPEAEAVRGDAVRLRLAFDALIEKAFEAVPERGDLYVASRRQGHQVRVMLRFHDPQLERGAGRHELEHSLGWLVADHLLTELGGRIAVADGGSGERVVLAELPAA
ncbi:MAG: hypothetical protein AAF430_07645 [Myxococcota bacterium]